MSDDKHTIQKGSLVSGEVEQNLEELKRQLSSLERHLAEQELALATFKAELIAFERGYRIRVGDLLAELDQLELNIAAHVMKNRPGDHKARAEYKAAKERAAASQSEAEATRHIAANQTRFRPTESIKALYKAIARKFHPDTATGLEEKKYKHEMMVQVNEAYAGGDEEGLKRLLQEGEPILEDFLNAQDIDRILIKRKIDQIRKRLIEISRETAELELSDIYNLKTKVEDASSRGIDLVGKMVQELREKIADRTRTLEVLSSAQSDAG